MRDPVQEARKRERLPNEGFEVSPKRRRVDEQARTREDEAKGRVTPETLLIAKKVQTQSQETDSGVVHELTDLQHVIPNAKAQIIPGFRHFRDLPLEIQMLIFENSNYDTIVNVLKGENISYSGKVIRHLVEKKSADLEEHLDSLEWRKLPQGGLPDKTFLTLIHVTNLNELSKLAENLGLFTHDTMIKVSRPKDPSHSHAFRGRGDYYNVNGRNKALVHILVVLEKKPNLFIALDVSTDETLNLHRVKVGAGITRLKLNTAVLKLTQCDAEETVAFAEPIPKLRSLMVTNCTPCFYRNFDLSKLHPRFFHFEFHRVNVLRGVHFKGDHFIMDKEFLGGVSLDHVHDSIFDFETAKFIMCQIDYTNLSPYSGPSIFNVAFPNLKQIQLFIISQYTPLFRGITAPKLTSVQISCGDPEKGSKPFRQPGKEYDRDYSFMTDVIQMDLTGIVDPLYDGSYDNLTHLRIVYGANMPDHVPLVFVNLEVLILKCLFKMDKVPSIVAHNLQELYFEQAQTTPDYDDDDYLDGNYGVAAGGPFQVNAVDRWTMSFKRLKRLTIEQEFNDRMFNMKETVLQIAPQVELLKLHNVEDLNVIFRDRVDQKPLEFLKLKILKLANSSERDGVIDLSGIRANELTSLYVHVHNQKVRLCCFPSLEYGDIKASEVMQSTICTRDYPDKCCHDFNITLETCRDDRCERYRY